jgi:hypothetical protein
MVKGDSVRRDSGRAGRWTPRGRRTPPHFRRTLPSFQRFYNQYWPLLDLFHFALIHNALYYLIYPSYNKVEKAQDHPLYPFFVNIRGQLQRHITCAATQDTAAAYSMYQSMDKLPSFWVVVVGRKDARKGEINGTELRRRRRLTRCSRRVGDTMHMQSPPGAALPLDFEYDFV